METYEGGGHAYHATLPTDALRQAARRDAGDRRPAASTRPRRRSSALGDACARCWRAKASSSVAAPRLPGAGRGGQLHRRRRHGTAARDFAALGLQIAAGVPLAVRRAGADFQTFRIGLFGLDKLMHVDRTVESLDRALSALL